MNKSRIESLILHQKWKKKWMWIGHSLQSPRTNKMALESNLQSFNSDFEKYYIKLEFSFLVLNLKWLIFLMYL